MSSPQFPTSDEPPPTQLAPSSSQSADPWETRLELPSADVGQKVGQPTLNLLGTEDQSTISDRFGDYRIIRYIAKGGMGAVYEAVHVELDLPVALKVINAGDSAREQDIQRFLMEARAVAALHSHPSIVKIHDIGQELGQHYLVMQLIHGRCLRERLGEYRNDPRKAVQLMIKVADAISHAHRKGLLHRDLKPDNVLIDDETGAPYVTDFGLAKRVDPAEFEEEPSDEPHLRHKAKKAAEHRIPVSASSSRLLPLGFESTQTEGGTVLGTPSFMPPEQARGHVKDISTLSDVYGLGATMFAVLCGRAPFLGQNVRHILDQVIDDPPPSPRALNPKVDIDLAAICLKCLEKDPRNRYESAHAFGRDLHRWLDGKPVHARPLKRQERTIRWIKNEPVKVAIVGLVVTMAALGVGLAVVRHWEVLELHSKLQAENQAMAFQHRARLAESGIREARLAISHMVDASEAELANDPRQQTARKKILSQALSYFTDVVGREELDGRKDFSHRLELALVHLQVAKLAEKIGDERRELANSHYAAAREILIELDGQARSNRAIDPRLGKQASEALAECSRHFADRKNP